jgi:hypothetical protein
MPLIRTLFSSACLSAALAAPLASAHAPSPSAPTSMRPSPQTPAEPSPARYAVTLARELGFGSNGMSFGINALPVDWGQTLTLPTSEATMKSNGICTFRSQFFVRNVGFLASVPTQNTVRLNASNGALLSSTAMGSIPYLAFFNNSSDIQLAPGTWTLYVMIDAPNTNAEYYESNNLNRVRVIVSGSCN